MRIICLRDLRLYRPEEGPRRGGGSLQDPVKRRRQKQFFGGKARRNFNPSRPSFLPGLAVKTRDRRISRGGSGGGGGLRELSELCVIPQSGSAIWHSAQEKERRRRSHRLLIVKQWSPQKHSLLARPSHARGRTDGRTREGAVSTHTTTLHTLFRHAISSFYEYN